MGRRKGRNCHRSFLWRRRVGAGGRLFLKVLGNVGLRASLASRVEADARRRSGDAGRDGLEMMGVKRTLLLGEWKVLFLLLLLLSPAWGWCRRVRVVFVVSVVRIGCRLGSQRCCFAGDCGLQLGGQCDVSSELRGRRNRGILTVNDCRMCLRIIEGEERENHWRKLSKARRMMLARNGEAGRLGLGGD